MARLSAKDQIEALRKQQLEIAKRIKDAEAAAKKQFREDEARRESLIGRLILNYMAEYPGDTFSRTIIALLDKGLTRPADRELFADLQAGDILPDQRESA